MKLSSNKRFFLNIFSSVSAVYGLAALPAVLSAAYFDENRVLAVLSFTSSVCIITGIVIKHVCDLSSSAVRQRINYLTVMLCWLFAVSVTAVSLFFAADGISPSEALFEAVSALTATGTGCLGAYELPESLMLWHSVLNWLGGTGIILIAAGIFTSRDFSGRALITIEIPGSDFLRSPSTFMKTCRHIITIYTAMTLLHFVLLCIAGMAPFTSLMTALSNVSTAGLQHIDHGIITSLPAAQKIIIAFFSLMGSLNVSLFLYLFFSKARGLRRHSETILYTVRIFVSALIILLILYMSGSGFSAGAACDTFVQTISFLTTSGYIAADCGSWPMLCQALIILQVFMGACAASTGGGIKFERVGIGFRTVKFGLFRSIHPQAVKPLRVGGETIRPDQFMGVNLYICLFALIYLAGALFLTLDTKIESVYEALNYSQAMLTNTGTSIAEVDMAGQSVLLSPFSMFIMSLEMLCGRLEIYPVLMLLSGSLLRSERNR